MKKILPLVALHETDNYISNGVDFAIMGTNFGSKAQAIIYDLDEIIETNEKLPVMGLFNRDFKQAEISQLLHEITSLYEGGLEYIIITDEGIVQAINDLDLDLKIIYKTESKINAEAMEKLYALGVDEIILTDVAVSIPDFKEKRNIGIHFFGKNFTHTHHEDAHFHVEDNHGKHHYSHDVYSLIHAFQTLKDKEISTLYFESFGLDLDDVLFVVRTLELVDDHKEFENLVYDTINIEAGHDHE